MDNSYVLEAQRQAACCAFDAELERQRPSVLFRPKVYRDGDKWCALYGEDIQAGVCGFGDSPEAATREFDNMWLGVSV